MRGILISLLAIVLITLSDNSYAQSYYDSSQTLQINRIIIIGNKRTKDWVIQRELSVHEGDTISSSRLNKALDLDRKKIYNLRIFHTATIKALELPDQKIDLLIEVEERWFTFPIPIFELYDRNFNEWWQNYDHKLNRTLYGLKLYQFNFRGRNETIRLTTRFGFTRKFDLLYRIPYIDKKRKQGLIFEFDYSEPKNLAYRTVDHKLEFLSNTTTLRRRFISDVTYTYRKSFYETHGITFEFAKGTISDTIRDLNTKFNTPNYYSGAALSQWYTSLAYTFISEHRDVIAYPLNGYYISTEIRKIGLGLGEKVNQFQLHAIYSWHKHVGNNFFFSNYTAGYYSTPNAQPYSLYYGQGFKKQFVRGFEIYVIEGPWFGLNKTTLKKRILNKVFRLDVLPWERFQHVPFALYFKTHFDFGYTRNYDYYKNNSLNTLLTNKLIYGVGTGLDFVTAYDGVIRIEYTYNSLGAYGFFFHLKKEF